MIKEFGSVRIIPEIYKKNLTMWRSSILTSCTVYVIVKHVCKKSNKKTSLITKMNLFWLSFIAKTNLLVFRNKWMQWHSSPAYITTSKKMSKKLINHLRYVIFTIFDFWNLNTEGWKWLEIFLQVVNLLPVTFYPSLEN